MITFARAIEVEPGQVIDSAHHNSLAASINERLLSGLGNGQWRITEHLLGLVRAMVMGNEEGATHAEGEFLETFQRLGPNVANWPLGGVDPVSGLPEADGPNIANPLMAFVYGVKARGVDPESGRLNAVPVAFLSDTDEQKWAAAKLIRGFTDPADGFTVSPMRELAQSCLSFAFPKGGQYATTYGGFLPGPAAQTPECVPPCDLTLSSCNTYPRVNLDVFFTATRPDVTATGLHFDTTGTTPWTLDPTQDCVVGHYAGTCSPCVLGDWATAHCPADNYATHINLMYELPAGFVVLLNDGTVDRLRRNDWIEGPYTQVTQLSRDLGDQIGRAVHAFMREFRGSDSQRQAESYYLDDAFDMQAFMTGQFPLAPARGSHAGDEITGIYPAWTIEAGTWAAGQKLLSNHGTTSYSWQDQFVATRCFFVFRNESGKTASLKVTHSAGSFTVLATSDGKIQKLDSAEPLYGVTVELVGDVTLDEGESIEIEFDELESYKPQWWDAYAVLRKGGARLVGAVGGEIADAFVDGQGVDEDDAKAIGLELDRTGCLINVHEVTNISDPTAVNENAVFEAIRRLSQHVTVLNRFTLLDYEVNSSGDSVLYFTPHPRTSDLPMTLPTDDGDQDIDVFAGMYVSDAPDGGVSSRWIMRMDLKPFVNDPDSPWRPDTYADQLVELERCVVFDSTVNSDLDMMRFINRGQSGLIPVATPVVPDGWTYAQLLADNRRWINHTTGPTDEFRTNQVKACPIYKRPVEVRAIDRMRENGRDIVRVTMKGRLQSTVGETAGADAVIPRSGWIENPAGAGAWDHDGLMAEPYRTDENGLMLYLSWRWKGTLPPGMGDSVPGDKSMTAGRGWPSGMLASILPQFSFLHLIPEAIVDDNSEYDSSDSVFDHEAELQAEWYTRCMAEGCVAGTGTLNCDNPAAARMYDWKWANLCEQMFGLRSVSAFATRPTKDENGVDLLTDADVRPDGPEGFGPMPTTYGSAEVFNRLVRVVNAMNRFRVMLPWLAEERHSDALTVTLDAGKAADNGCGLGSDCASGIGSGASISTGLTPPVAGLGTFSDWAEIPFPATMRASTGHNITACYGPIPDHWGLSTTRTAYELRFSILDWSIYQHACDPSWRDMVAGASEHVGALFSLSRERVWNDKAAGTHECSDVDRTHVRTFDCQFIEHRATYTSCFFMRNGYTQLDAGPAPPGGWSWLWLMTDAHGVSIPCSGGSGDQMDVTMVTDTCPVLEVPVEDRAEGEQPIWIRR